MKLRIGKTDKVAGCIYICDDESGYEVFAVIDLGQESEANATELVRRWNSHDALVKALEEAIDIVEGHPKRSPFVAVEDWKAAIAETKKT